MTILPLVVKRLTNSDLTFFRWHFDNRNAGNQKAINLNADVFVDILFPGLPRAAERLDWRVTIDARLFGPGGAPEYRLQRKIIKGASYKNWRMNGEFIFNPDDSPERFNILEAGDLALMRFETADGIVPHAATILFLSRSSAADRELHAALASRTETRSMATLSFAEFESTLSAVGAADGHPAFELTSGEDIADVPFSGAAARRRLRRRRGGRIVSPEELRLARKLSEDIGAGGEELVNGWLRSRPVDIESHEWTSSVNAISPFDFTVERTGGSELAEVKSTCGPHERVFHLSIAELEEAATSALPYRIYRVSALDDAGGLLQISEPINDFAAGIEPVRHSRITWMGRNEGDEGLR